MLNLADIAVDSFPDSHVISRDDQRSLTWKQFLADVAANRRSIRETANRDWSLYEEDVYRFAVGLFALLSENRRVFLPGDNNSAVTAALDRVGTTFLGRFPRPDVRSVCVECPTAAFGPETFRLAGEMVIFTSGSTGEAKRIAKTLRQIEAEIGTHEQLWGQEIGAAEILGGVSPQHLYGLLFLVFWPICSGRPFWRNRFENPARIAKATAGLKNAVWIMSPAHLNRLGNCIDWEPIRGSIAAIFSSGGPLTEQAIDEIRSGLARPPIEVLGSSETGGIAWRRPMTGNTPWTPFPPVRVAQAENGALKIRSPFLPDDRWFTGDDSIDIRPDGAFLLGERLDRIVKIEGKRVSLPEIEAVISGHPWVIESSAIPLQRKRQSVGVMLALSQEGRSNLEVSGRRRFLGSLREHCRDRLPDAAVPKYWRFVDALPRNAQGKIVLKEVRQQFGNERLPDILRREQVGNGLRLTLRVDADCPYFQGHFPGFAVLPGVVQLHWAEYFGRKFLPVAGEFLEMRRIKFMELVLNLEYAEDDGKLSFSFASAAGQHSRGDLYFGAPP